MERSIFSTLTELFTGDTASEERKLSLQLSKQMLIQRLKDALVTVVRNAIAPDSEQSSDVAPLHDQSPGVQDLLLLIEACFAHGLKPQNVIAHDYPADYWDFIH